MRCSDGATSLGHLILVAPSLAKNMAYFQVKHKNKKRWQQIDRYQLFEDLFEHYQNIEKAERTIEDIEKGEVIKISKRIYRRDPKELRICSYLNFIQKKLRERQKDWEEYVKKHNDGTLDLKWIEEKFPEIVKILGKLKREDVWKYGYIPAAIVFGRFMK